MSEIRVLVLTITQHEDLPDANVNLTVRVGAEHWQLSTPIPAPLDPPEDEPFLPSWARAVLGHAGEAW